ncbi:uncharacterized protein LOC131650140 [Vicia villosa]|uniref:uncharacterized protein LOC131650140 n=1 Tax=Vicia villosa TaxID=3911 RepID=UPI00273BA3DB|nr:uncharacterized protein LOC131650140 [Vicia villosa]
MGGAVDPIERRKASIWWKDLVKLGSNSFFDPFVSSCMFLLRNGYNIPFWDVMWMNGLILKEVFPNLYEASSLKMVSVAAMGGWVDNRWTWGNCGISENRLLEHEVAVEWGIFRGFLEEYGVIGSERDRAEWITPRGEDFSVASCYEKYAFYRIPFGLIGRHNEAKILVWKTDVPFKIKAFGWRLLANRLPTKYLLAIRGNPLSFDASLCSFCKIDPENRDHSFFSCSFVKNIWRDIAVWIGKEGLVEEESYSSFMEWHSFCISKKVLDKKVDIVWLAITWALWLSRNGVCFREEVWSFDNVVWNIKALVWRWSFYGENTHPNYSYYDFVKDPIRFLS